MKFVRPDKGDDRDSGLLMSCALSLTSDVEEICKHAGKGDGKHVKFDFFCDDMLNDEDQCGYQLHF